MKRIVSTDLHTVTPGSRVWVKEWDELYRVAWSTDDGNIVVMGWERRSVLNPSKLSIYLMTPEEPATGPAGVFYHVAQVNWL